MSPDPNGIKVRRNVLPGLPQHKLRYVYIIVVPVGFQPLRDSEPQVRRGQASGEFGEDTLFVGGVGGVEGAAQSVSWHRVVAPFQGFDGLGLTHPGRRWRLALGSRMSARWPEDLPLALAEVLASPSCQRDAAN